MHISMRSQCDVKKYMNCFVKVYISLNDFTGCSVLYVQCSESSVQCAVLKRTS